MMIPPCFDEISLRVIEFITEHLFGLICFTFCHKIFAQDFLTFRLADANRGVLRGDLQERIVCLGLIRCRRHRRSH